MASRKLAQNFFPFPFLFYIFLEKLHRGTSLLNKGRFKHRISVVEDAGEFGKADFILLLEKGVITGCSHNEDHKISNHIFSTLLEYEYEVNAKQEVSVRRGLLVLDPKTALPEKTKISNRKKTVTKYL